MALSTRDLEDGPDAWTVVGVNDGAVGPAVVGGGTAVRLTSVIGQPAGVERWFDGLGFGTASARVSVVGADSALVTLEVVRLDGTVVDDQTVSVDGGQGWVTVGDVFWSSSSEDVLVYRVTTTGTGDVLVDWTLVGLTT